MIEVTLSSFDVWLMFGELLAIGFCLGATWGLTRSYRYKLVKKEKSGT